MFKNDQPVDESSYEHFVIRYQYVKDPQSLTRFLKFMLWVSIVIGAVLLVSELLQMELLSTHYSQAQAEENDLRQTILSRLFLAVYFVSGIMFFKWIYRANENSRGFGSEGMRFTPGWTIGYYFIPILNLFKPYQAIKEIWQVAKDPEDWSSQGVSPLLAWFWGMWLMNGVIAQLSYMMITAASSVSSLQTATMVSVISDIVSIITVWLLLNIVVKISQMHQCLVSRVSVS